MVRAERDPHDLLNDHLDAFTATARARWDDAPEERDSTEPDLARTFRHLRALDAEQESDPALARRIWEELMNDATLGAAAPVLLGVDASPGGLNGRGAPRPWRAGLLDRRPSREHRVSLLAQAATVLLLIAATLAGYMAIRPLQQGPAPARLGASPTAGNPTIVRDDGAQDMLLQATIAPDRDASTIDLSFWRGAIAPGDQVSSPPDWAAHDGVEVELVLRGTLVLQADAPLRIVRASSSPGEETAPAGAEVILAPGDAAIIPSASTRTYRNPGDDTVELLGVLSFTGGGRIIEQLSLADGYLIRNGNLMGFIPTEDAPPGPLMLTLARMAGAENAWPAQAIREDGVVEWRMLEFSPVGTPEPDRPGGTVYVLTLAPA